MDPRRRNLTSSQAAAHLGVTAKALRLYEEATLLNPGRSSAGWRLYGPDDIERAATIVSLRSLGLSLAQVARALDGDASSLKAGLAAREEQLVLQSAHIEATLQKLRALSHDVNLQRELDVSALQAAIGGNAEMSVGFELPWPWAGEWFELRDFGPLNFITGPLGSGKTRFAERLAAELPNAFYVGRDRLSRGCVDQSLRSDAALATRVARALDWLKEEGAELTEALRALVSDLENDQPTVLVVDMVEDGLCNATQRALMAWLRLKRSGRAVFLMTRSSSILDVDLVRANERVIYCPANHSPPFLASLSPRGDGFEAVSTCVATPQVRTRTAGLVAIRSGAVEPV